MFSTQKHIKIETFKHLIYENRHNILCPQNNNHITRFCTSSTRDGSLLEIARILSFNPAVQSALIRFLNFSFSP